MSRGTNPKDILVYKQIGLLKMQHTCSEHHKITHKNKYAERKKCQGNSTAEKQGIEMLKENHKGRSNVSRKGSIIETG